MSVKLRAGDDVQLRFEKFDLGMRPSEWSRKQIIRVLFVSGLLVIAVGCATVSKLDRPDLPPGDPSVQSDSGQTAGIEPDAETLDSGRTVVMPDIQRVPKLNVGKASIPLEDIVFDTFGRFGARFFRLDQIEEDIILELRDAIAPIYNPVYGGPDSLSWLGDYDLIVGYVSADSAYAYPINILNLHELVNETIDGIPVLISYCPLCASGVTYNRELDGQVLLFGNTSALYQSDLVMYDHQTGSYWFQVGGEAVVGELTGSHLSLLPSETMAWKDWLELHPDTRVLTGTAGSPDRFSSRRYGQGFSSGYQERVNKDEFIFPVDRDMLDPRMASGDLILTVEAGGAITAYPLDRIGSVAVNDQVGGLPVVVFNLEKGKSASAYYREVDGRVLTFDYREDGRSITDNETGSVWDLAGRAAEGPLTGAQLERANTRRGFWFSIAIAFPNVELYQP